MLELALPGSFQAVPAGLANLFSSSLVFEEVAQRISYYEGDPDPNCGVERLGPAGCPAIPDPYAFDGSNFTVVELSGDIDCDAAGSDREPRCRQANPSARRTPLPRSTAQGWLPVGLRPDVGTRRSSFLLAVLCWH